MKSLFRIIFITALIVGVSSCSSREAWDFVTLGDSFLARSSIPEQYAEFIEEDMGADVVLHEKSVNGQEPAKLLANLQNDEELRQLTREAEVIVFDFSPGWADSAELKYLLGNCEGDDNQQCLREALESAKADWMKMADLLAELTTGKSVILHTFIFGDWPYNGYYKDKLTPEQRTTLLGYFHEFQEFQKADALARGMFVHHVFPPEMSDPPPAKYFQSDGLHLSDEGSLFVSSMMRNAGYKTTWTYLIWGTQIQTLGSDFPEEYAAYLEEEMGVDVEIVNYAGGSKESIFIYTLESKQDLIDVVRRAKLMTFDWNPSSTDSAERKFLNGECGGTDNRDCLREAYAQAQKDWLAVLNRVIEIRGGDTTGMRQIVMGTWPYMGHYPNITVEQRDVLVGHFLEMASFLMAEAEAREIEIVQVFPGKYFDNPPPEDWIYGVSLTEEGDKVIVDALKEIELSK
jgi:hypothetical protein